jgi:flagellar motor switch protein FliM
MGDVLSQDDLSALLGPMLEAPAPGPKKSAQGGTPPAGDSLSQEEIDRLLKEFGK